MGAGLYSTWDKEAPGVHRPTCAAAFCLNGLPARMRGHPLNARSCVQRLAIAQLAQVFLAHYNCGLDAGGVFRQPALPARMAKSAAAAMKIIPSMLTGPAAPLRL